MLRDACSPSDSARSPPTSSRYWFGVASASFRRSAASTMALAEV